MENALKKDRNKKTFEKNDIEKLDKYISIEYPLETYHRSNQDTCLVHKPSVFEGQWVESGDLLADCSASVGGELSLGQNILIGYMPWEGYNFEDAILISERLVYDDLYTSIHIERYEVTVEETKLGVEEITREIPEVQEKSLRHLNSLGIAKIGSWVEEGDILIGKVTPINKKNQSNYQKLLYLILDKTVSPVRDSSLRAPKGIKAKVIGIQLFKSNRNSLFFRNEIPTSLNSPTLDSVPLALQRSFRSKRNKGKTKQPFLSVARKRREAKQPLALQGKVGARTPLGFATQPNKQGIDPPQEKIRENETTPYSISNFFTKSSKKIKNNRVGHLIPYSASLSLRVADRREGGNSPCFVFQRSKPFALQGKTKQAPLLVSTSLANKVVGQQNYDGSSFFPLGRRSKPFALQGNKAKGSNRRKNYFVDKAKRIESNEGRQFQLEISKLWLSNFLTMFQEFKTQSIDGPEKKKSQQRKLKNSVLPTKSLLPMALLSPKADRKQNISTVAKPRVPLSFGTEEPALTFRRTSFFSNQNNETSHSLDKKDKTPPALYKIRPGKGTVFLKGISSIQVYLAEKRRVQVGDKMAGRHGNKGIISEILPIEDLPYLPDGTPLDMVLNPLGVPSRMNVGQIYECLLGLAGKHLGENFKVFPFDEIYGAEASRSFVYSKLYSASLKTGKTWLFNPNLPGKLCLYDGRTGDSFHQAITVGYAYILRLVHMVDDKMHSRSTGPYSLVTQQPLRGRSKHGGQRLGEMEVWALEGYGAAFTLLEMLTIKSDDMSGRMTLWSNLILNKEISIGTPESFKVLICELQALCLDIGLFRMLPSKSKLGAIPT